MGTEITCDIAWAAGFFDGEGCIRNTHWTNKVNRNTRYGLQITITQKHREPLDRFQRIFGCGKVYRHKDGHFVFSMAKLEEVDFVLEKMWPFMCSVKRADANRAIERVGVVA